jgi:alpha-L-arabinofuranosidase
VKKNLRITATAVLVLLAMAAPAQKGGEPAKANLIIETDLGSETISRHIYGHFSEHLGRCIYGGYWVGEESSIVNTRGIRNDVVEALKRHRYPT